MNEEEKQTQNPNLHPNLKPFPKGVSGNPKGRPKGTKNWSTVVRDLLNDEELLDKISKNKPSYYEHLPVKNGAHAIVIAMMIEALKGKKEAAEWLRKTGWGDKIDITSGEERISMAPIIISEIKPRNVTTSAQAETDTDDTDNQPATAS